MFIVLSSAKSICICKTGFEKRAGMRVMLKRVCFVSHASRSRRRRMEKFVKIKTRQSSKGV